MNFADGYATDKVHLLYIKLCDGIAVEIWQKICFYLLTNGKVNVILS